MVVVSVILEGEARATELPTYSVGVAAWADGLFLHMLQGCMHVLQPAW